MRKASPKNKSASLLMRNREEQEAVWNMTGGRSEAKGERGGHQRMEEKRLSMLGGRWEEGRDKADQGRAFGGRGSFVEEEAGTQCRGGPCSYWEAIVAAMTASQRDVLLVGDRQREPTESRGGNR